MGFLLGLAARQGKENNMSMYAPYIDLIKNNIKDGYNIKEINEKLKEEGVYGEYSGLYWFCRNHGIVAEVKRTCRNCKNCVEYENKEIGSITRVCNAEKAVIKAKIVPRWCNNRFVNKDASRTTNFEMCCQSKENMASIIDIVKVEWGKEKIVEWLNQPVTVMEEMH